MSTPYKVVFEVIVLAETPQQAIERAVEHAEALRTGNVPDVYVLNFQTHVAPASHAEVVEKCVIDPNDALPPGFPASMRGKHLVVAQVPLEIIFSTDPEELGGLDPRTSEPAPTDENVAEFLREQVIVDVQEDRTEPSGSVFQSAALKMGRLRVWRP